MIYLSNLDWAYGSAALLGFFCATFADPKTRTYYMMMAALVFINWFNYVTSYTPQGIAPMLWGWGLMIHNEHIWQLLDFVCGSAALIMWFLVVSDRYDSLLGWPMLVVSMLFLVQIGLHAAFWDMRLLSDQLYYATLNDLFKAQVAAFIFVGGPGIGDRLIHSARSAYGVLGPVRTAYQQASK